MHIAFDDEGIDVTCVNAADANELFDVFEQIGEEQGWDARRELSAFAQNSVCLVAARDQVPIGGIMLVLGNDSQGLPITDTWPELPLRGREDVVDLAMTGLLRAHRGDLLSLSCLYFVVWKYCADNRITEIWTEVPPRHVRLYRRMWMPMSVMGEEREDCGRMHLPCRILVDELGAAVDREGRKSLAIGRILDRVRRTDLSGSRVR